MDGPVGPSIWVWPKAAEAANNRPGLPAKARAPSAMRMMVLSCSWVTTTILPPIGEYLMALLTGYNRLAHRAGIAQLTIFGSADTVMFCCLLTQQLFGVGDPLTGDIDRLARIGCRRHGHRRNQVVKREVRRLMASRCSTWAVTLSLEEPAPISSVGISVRPG
jgi:hypothetical protein